MPRPPAYGAPLADADYSSLVRGTPGLVLYSAGLPAIASFTGYNFTMPAQFTMECWVNWTSIVANAGLLSNWITPNGPMLWLQSSPIRVSFRVNTTELDSGLTPVAGQWYHFVGTYDGTSRAIYANGTLRNGPTSGITPTASGSALVFGAYNDILTPKFWPVNGKVADCAVYQRALTAAEVLAHYAAGCGRP